MEPPDTGRGAEGEGLSYARAPRRPGILQEQQGEALSETEARLSATYPTVAEALRGSRGKGKSAS
jgi:hypothetical protein